MRTQHTKGSRELEIAQRARLSAQGELQQMQVALCAHRLDARRQTLAQVVHTLLKCQVPDVHCVVWLEQYHRAGGVHVAHVAQSDDSGALGDGAVANERLAARVHAAVAWVSSTEDRADADERAGEGGVTRRAAAGAVAEEHQLRVRHVEWEVTGGVVVGHVEQMVRGRREAKSLCVGV